MDDKKLEAIVSRAMRQAKEAVKEIDWEGTSAEEVQRLADNAAEYAANGIDSVRAAISQIYGMEPDETNLKYADLTQKFQKMEELFTEARLVYLSINTETLED